MRLCRVQRVFMCTALPILVLVLSFSSWSSLDQRSGPPLNARRRAGVRAAPDSRQRNQSAPTDHSARILLPPLARPPCDTCAIESTPRATQA